MKKFFQNLKIRTKLIAGFIFISLIVILTGVKEYFTLNKLSKNQSVIIQSLVSVDEIREINSVFILDKNIITEIENSEETKKLEVLFNNHINFSENIREKLIKLRTSFIHKENIKQDSTIENIEKVLQSIENKYNNQIELQYEKLYNIKIEKAKTEASTLIYSIPDSLDEMKRDSLRNEMLNKHNEIIADLLAKQMLITNNLNQTYNSALSDLYGIEEFITKSVDVIQKKSNNLVDRSLKETPIIILIGLSLSIIIAILIANAIFRPLNTLRIRIDRFAKGDLPEHIESISNNEIGAISSSLNALVTGLEKTSEFSVEIGKGNFGGIYKPLSKKDTLGNSLLEMRKSLQQAKIDEEKRKKEDQLRTWSTEGQAKFAEILRQGTDDLRELSNVIIKNIVKYLNANQGGIFIINNDDNANIYIELYAAYAYNRKKFIEKKITYGEGLIGSCAVEKKTIRLSEIPDDYIEIKSGLGDANPSSLILIPLLIEDKIMGIIEIASFSIFEDHQVAFLEKVGESIAATFSNVKINNQTNKLLKKSQIQAEEMAAKEEQMRQNIEEMRATQEEIEQRENELINKNEELTKKIKTLNVN